MGYRRAEEILPQEMIEMIQQYVDGQSIYIPRKDEHRASWGSNTSTRKELAERNQKIYADYCCGFSVSVLANQYFLSEKSIQRIIRELKNDEMGEPMS